MNFLTLLFILLQLLHKKIDAACFVATTDENYRERIALLKNVKSDGHCAFECDKNPECWATYYENGLCALLREAKPNASICTVRKTLTVKCTSEDSDSNPTACKSIKERMRYFAISSKVSIEFNLDSTDTPCFKNSAGEEFWAGNNGALPLNGLFDAQCSLVVREQRNIVHNEEAIERDHASTMIINTVSGISVPPKSTLFAKRLTTTIGYSISCLKGKMMVMMLNGTIVDDLVDNEIQRILRFKIESTKHGSIQYDDISTIYCIGL